MDKEIILYSSGCPQCKVLEAKLDQKKIQYRKVEDTQLMIDRGFTRVPILEVENEIYDFSAAIKWIGEYTK